VPDVEVDYSKFGPQDSGVKLPSSSSLVGPGKLAGRSSFGSSSPTSFQPQTQVGEPNPIVANHRLGDYGIEPKGPVAFSDGSKSYCSDVSPLYNMDRTLPDSYNMELIDFDLSVFEDLDHQGDLSNTQICEESDMDISLIYFYHKLVHPPESYQKFLDYLSQISLKSYPGLGKFTGFKAWEHYNGSRVILPEIETEEYNPADKFQSIRSSASRTAKQLTNLNWLPSSDPSDRALVNLDLTFPADLSDRLLGGVEDLEDRYWATYKTFLELFNDRKPDSVRGSYDVGNSSNLHLWSSSDPLNPNAHFHSSMIWAQEIRPSEGAQEDSDGFGKSYLKPLEWSDNGKPADSGVIKSLWAKAVNKEFGTDYCEDPEAYRNGTSWINQMFGHSQVVANVSWTPLSPSFWTKDKDDPKSTIKRKLIHRLKYCRRKPLTDLGEYFVDNEFSQEDVNVGFALDLIEYGNSSRQFGYWTHINSCVNVKDDEGEESNLCPVCGEEVRDVYPLDEEEYDPDKLVKIGKRGGVWSGKPPDNRHINLNSKRANSPTINQPEDLGGIDE